MNQTESHEKISNCSTQDSQDEILFAPCKKFNSHEDHQVLDFGFLQMAQSPRDPSNILLHQTLSEETTTNDGEPSQQIKNNEQAHQSQNEGQSQSQEEFTDNDSEMWETQDFQDAENGFPQQQVQHTAIHDKLPEIEAKLYLQRNAGFFVFMSVFSLCLYLLIEGYIRLNFLFFPIYVYLSYHLYETKKRRAYGTRDDWRVKEDVFAFLDNLNMMFFVASVQLMQDKVMNTCNLIFILHLLATTFYFLISSAPQATKTTRTIVRSIFALQFLLISLKLTGELQWEWKYTLALFWLYLGVIGVYLIAYTSILILLTSLTLLGRQQNGEIDLFTQFRGLIWHCTYYCLGGVAAALIVGLNDFYAENSSTNVLKLAAMVGMGLSTFLAIYTFFLVGPLTKYIQIFSLSDGAVFSSEVQGNFFEDQDEPEVKIKIESEKKEVYMMMLSSTYFKILSENMGKLLKPILNDLNSSQGNKSDFINSIIKEVNPEVQNYLKPTLEENEDSLCYLCCEKQSDAVLDGCGHGGICSICAVNLLAKKSECMECRNSVNSFFRIDTQYKVSNIVKTLELCKVIKH